MRAFPASVGRYLPRVGAVAGRAERLVLGEGGRGGRSCGGTVPLHLLRRRRPPAGAVRHHDGDVLIPGRLETLCYKL